MKRLRDSIETHRLNNVFEVNLMRNKQKLFREYCELKKEFVSSSNSEPDDIEIQLEILDETWAKWIQDVETRPQELSHADSDGGTSVETLQIVLVGRERFESDNIFISPEIRIS